VAAVETTMLAARMQAGTRELRLEEVPVPTPGPNEVRVRVRACGICLSDVHLLDGTLGTPTRTVTLGHEAAGEVDLAGSHVTGWKPGQRVVVGAGRTCGRCHSCLRARADACMAGQILGIDYDGAWAEYVVVPAAALAAVPEALPVEQAAIIADAVSTPYAGLVDRAALRPSESVGLWGIGGLGVHAVQIARVVGAAPIIAVDPSARARERALAVGADVALDPRTDDVRARILEMTDGQGLDVACDVVGANAVMKEATGCLGRAGRVVMIGLSAEPLELGPGVMLGLGRQAVLGHLGYRREHLDQLVKLVGHGRLDLSASVTEVMPLTDVHRGVRALENKEGDPIRLVVTP
jgi:D-arabinose 1-dehydrogenase-like Zn-dependent alcohol dehydrogenase